MFIDPYIKVCLTIVFKNSFLFFETWKKQEKHVWQLENWFMFSIFKNRKYGIFRDHL